VSHGERRNGSQQGEAAANDLSHGRLSAQVRDQSTLLILRKKTMSDKEKQWDGLGKLLNDVGGNYVNSVRDGINQSVADDAAFAKKYPGAVRGGTAMVDFNAVITPTDVGHLTVNPPAIGVGGNPNNVLLRRRIQLVDATH
jgi:hypothetical protein